MLVALGLEGAELSVLLCDDRRIAELNEQYRGVEGPADVLSFPMEDDAGPPGARLLGDVVISMPTAARQAGGTAGALREEVTRLLAHGLLHLSGRTHETAAKLRAMERETERLMALATPRRRSGA